MSEKPLDHAREQYQDAKTGLEQREWDLVFQIQAEIRVQLDTVDRKLAQTHELVREIPERPSLDHNAGRLDTMKKIQEIRRELARVEAAIGRLGGPHG